MNAGLVYYREYYAEIDLRPKPRQDDTAGMERYRHRAAANKGPLKEANARLLNLSLQEIWEQVAPVENRLADQHVLLKTTYPGLLAGSGYPHEFRQDEAFMLGCSFDHTTGLPVIPGSSVKGLLRFACEADDGKHLKEMVQQLTGSSLDLDLEAFVDAVFDGSFKKDDKKERLCSGDRDLFFDALPVISANPGHRVLGDDFITPHLHRPDRSMDGLKNPVPLRFLKVLPDVTFDFRFHLTGIKGGLTAAERKTLFEHILLLHGIGAKTNVGYGQFVALSKEEVADYSKWQEERQEKWLEARQKLEEEKAKAEQKEQDELFRNNFAESMPEIKVKREDTFEAILFRIADKKYFFSYEANGKKCTIQLIRKKIKAEEPGRNPAVGDKARLKVTQDYDPRSSERLTANATLKTETP